MSRGSEATRERAEEIIAVLHECLEEGYPWENRVPGEKGARTVACERLNLSTSGLHQALKAAKRRYDIEPDPSRYVPRKPEPMFRISSLPADDEEMDAEQLIEHLKRKHASRKVREDAAKLRHITINMDGPIGLALIGDPHIDDPGCAWGDLERDVRVCRDTPGMMAVNLGDTTNNWVGRLMGLYADQEVTTKQALKLIEWLLTSLPWLGTVGGNHDTWNTQKGDVAEVIHRLQKLPGLYENVGMRMQLDLPSGAHVRANIRHDFPGGSQFNPAHALVRETLFGFRDHILACGHRHHSGYIPVFHNDPVRLCHGFRVGAYKDWDKYAREKGFQEGNWARSMGAVIDPAYAHNHVRYIKEFFDLEEMGEYLTWRREKWRMGYSAAL
jgi:hypothetical protein